eukprot:m.207190 g.207190  ORF g.207190 m.207190 type:complete len:63 (+) comp15541_c2_seq3:466-654(+)
MIRACRAFNFDFKFQTILFVNTATLDTRDTRDGNALHENQFSRDLECTCKVLALKMALIPKV